MRKDFRNAGTSAAQRGLSIPPIKFFRHSALRQLSAPRFGSISS